MDLTNPLQPLHDLDRTSPQFHKQLSEFLRGNEYRNVLSSLQKEDLVWLVEYLDSVSLQILSPHSTLNPGVGARQFCRFCKCPVSGITTRAQKHMRHQRGAPEIMGSSCICSEHQPSFHLQLRV